MVVHLLVLKLSMPWAMSSSLGDDRLFFRPKHNIYALFMILFGLFDLILLFFLSNLSCQLWNRKLKINEIYFNKKEEDEKSKPAYLQAKSIFSIHMFEIFQKWSLVICIEVTDSKFWPLPISCLQRPKIVCLRIISLFKLMKSKLPFFCDRASNLS